jgi:hypothetical protein
VDQVAVDVKIAAEDVGRIGHASAAYAVASRHVDAAPLKASAAPSWIGTKRSPHTYK